MPIVPIYDNFKTTPGIREGRLDPGAVNAGQLSLPGRVLEQAGSAFAESSGRVSQSGARLSQAGSKLEEAGLQGGARIERAGAIMEREGRQITSTGNQMMEQFIQAQRHADALRVVDARNRLEEAKLKLTFDPQGGYTQIKGEDAISGQDGKPLADVYTDKLKTISDSLAEGLGNDAQRQLFSTHANQSITGFYGDVLKHEVQQHQVYALSKYTGSIKVDMDAIGLHWNEPDKVDQAVQSIQAASYELSRLKGQSAVEAEANAKALTSSAHMQAIGAAIQANNIPYAEGYLKKYAGQMEAGDILKVQGIVTKEMDSQVALGVSNTVMARYQPQMMPDDFQRAWNIAIKTESGGHQFGKDGKPLLSPDGAVGIAQVMPGTAPEAAKLAGLDWDKNRYRHDPAYNEALGKAYFQKQLQDFEGDLGKAYGAYNGGPGAVQKAVKAANKAGSPDWLSHMPAETQAYVAKNMKAFETGGGAGRKPTLYDIHNALRQEPALANHPARLKLALDDSERQFKEAEQAHKQQAEGAMADAYGWLAQNGGNYPAMPPLLKASVPADKQDDLLSFGKNIAAGMPVQTDWKLYVQLKTDHKALLDANLAASQDKLNPQQLKELADDQEKLKNAPEKEGTYLQSEEQYINTMLNQGGIDTTPKDGDTKAWERLGKARAMLQADISAAEQDAGRKLKREEKDKIIAQTVTRMLGKVHIDGWFGGDDVRVIDMNPEQKAKATPPDDQKKAIVAKLKAMGKPIDDNTVVGVYRKMMGF